MKLSINTDNTLNKEYELIREKLDRLREDIAIETDTLVKFKLQKQIERTEKEQLVILKRLGYNSLKENEGFRIKIYISSTCFDLAEYRKSVFDILNNRWYEVVNFEGELAEDKRPVKKSLSKLKTCHIYIGIFAWNYGYISPKQDRSITELEYLQAVELNKSCFFFVLDESVNWPKKYKETGYRSKMLNDLRENLLTKHSAKLFFSPKELAEQVDSAVENWAQSRLDTGIRILKENEAQITSILKDRVRQLRVVNAPILDILHIFKDRLSERKDLCKYLKNNKIRIINLVGRGGMGKTALASYVLSMLIEGQTLSDNPKDNFYVDGIIYLSARSTGINLERIFLDIKRMLGEPIAGELTEFWKNSSCSIEEKILFLLNKVRDGFYIVLLDNFEDVLKKNGDIEQDGLRIFLEYCLSYQSGIHIIITSREQINFPVSTLHAIRMIKLNKGLPPKEGVELLRALDPDDILGIRHAQEITLKNAVKKTAGIPRALELLAGILYEDPTINLSALLNNNELFDSQVVEKLMVASFEKIDDTTKRVMEALAIFRKPMDSTAISYLLYPWYPGLNTHTCLKRLVKSYFVNVNRITVEYSIHPLDQEYIYRLIPDSSINSLNKDYNKYSLELRAAEFYKELRKNLVDCKTLPDLFPQLNEFEHCIRGKDYNRACLLLEPLDFDHSNYLNLWGYTDLLIAMREQLVDKLEDNYLQASNLGNLGFAYRLMGKYNKAILYLEKALLAAKSSHNQNEIGTRLGHLAVLYRVTGRIDQSIKILKEALRLARITKDAHKESNWLGHIGTAYRAIGNFDQAISFYQKALNIANKKDDSQRKTFWLGHLGITYRILGCYNKSIGYFEKAREYANNINSQRHKAIWLDNYASVYRIRGQYSQAVELYNEALVISKKYEIRLGISFHMLGLGKCYLANKEFVKACEYCNEALTFDFPETNYQASFILGISLMHQDNIKAQKYFKSAICFCLDLLALTENLFEERFILSTAMIGYSVCDPSWKRLDGRNKILEPILSEYEKALRITMAPGIIKEVLYYLDIINSFINGNDLLPVYETINRYRK